ncbi:MAG: pyridoxal phosphate-dependent aminotransferase [Parachlamydia sp.]|jgi:aspartate/methionine/tyrosine aminotransferase|nr:pyridoxal phosphate-dependent aminotransferase [Parachlamydia sp.]
MRNDILSPEKIGLTYEIRNIVIIAEKLQKYGMAIHWENIGDPIAKGEKIPDWMKAIVAEAIFDNSTWGYCHTRGILDTRRFICERTNRRGGTQITPDQIIFFNGLGDAIGKIYDNLKSETRVLLPSPTYTTHSIGEARHAHTKSIHFHLDPQNEWKPNIEELENLVKFNPQIGAILIINPDNPTGFVYSKELLEQIVEIADKYGLFIISDEVYINIVYNNQKTVPLSDVIGQVPALGMKGISKEFPWPGSRCGWIEVYNYGIDSQFDQYVNSILTAKMNEVCSTTLPQKVIPAILQHPEYPFYLAERIRTYEEMSCLAEEIFSQVPELSVIRTNGAFYMAVVFKPGALKPHQTLPLSNPEIKELVEGLVSAPNTTQDKRFVYYLLAHTGICVVPLSSFSSSLQGFRITLLEKNTAETEMIFKQIADKFIEYLNS